MVDIYKSEGFKVDSERYTTMLFFLFLMQRGENIMFASNGYQLWNALRKLDTETKMPATYF
jgi:hypothetical protein